METSQSRLHPVLWVAAVSIIIFSAVGVAALTGVLPAAGSKPSEPLAAATTPAPTSGDVALAAPAEPAAKPAAAPAATTPDQAAPKPVAVKARSAAEPKPAPAKAVSLTKVATESKPKPVQVAQYDPPVEERSPGRGYEPIRSAEPPAPVSRTCRDCGVIETVREIKAQGEGSGLGAVAGGVLGGVLGHQVGGGRGRDVATVIGAVGGAVAGHQVEKNVRTGSKYEVVVRYDDGTSQTFQHDKTPAWRSGDRVKVVDGVITAN
jgi:outer membrane lipoprotein SlyB